MYSREELMEQDLEVLVEMVLQKDEETKAANEQQQNLLNQYNQELMRLSNQLNQYKEENIVLLRKVVAYQDRDLQMLLQEKQA